MRASVFYPSTPYLEKPIDSHGIIELNRFIELSNIPPVKGETKHDEFMRLVKDCSTDTIIAWRGGQIQEEDTHRSAIELIESLSQSDWDTVERSRKRIVGSSDVSFLLNAMISHGIQCYYGPNIRTSIFEASDDSARITVIEYLSKTLNGQLRELCFENQELTVQGSRPVVIKEGVSEGMLVGGNLSTTYWYVKKFGNPFKDIKAQKILFLEEIDPKYLKWGRPIISMEEMLSYLYDEGIMDNVSGLLFGRSKEPRIGDCEHGWDKVSNSEEMEPLRMAIERINTGNIPVVINLAFGHVPPVVTLPIGSLVRLNAKESRIVFL